MCFSASSGHPDALVQQLSDFLAPGTGFVKDSFSMDQQEVGMDGFRTVLIRSANIHPFHVKLTVEFLLQ